MGPARLGASLARRGGPAPRPTTGRIWPPPATSPGRQALEERRRRHHQYTPSSSTSKTSVALRGMSGGGASGAVAQLGRQRELALAAHLHAGDAAIPALDHLAGPEAERERRPADGGVELLPVREPAGVMHLDRLAADGLRTLAHHQVVDLRLRHARSGWGSTPRVTAPGRLRRAPWRTTTGPPPGGERGRRPEPAGSADGGRVDGPHPGRAGRGPLAPGGTAPRPLPAARGAPRPRRRLRHRRDCLTPGPALATRRGAGGGRAAGSLRLARERHAARRRGCASSRAASMPSASPTAPST